MNFIRRFYLSLLTILLIIGVTLFLVFPVTVSNWASVLSEQTPVLRILVALVIDLLLAAFLYLQVRPDARARATGLMMQASGAITEVSVESARARILKAVSDVPDVISADAEVKPIRGRADVELQVTVMGHDVELPGKQKEINRALNQVIHKQLGLQMAGQPRVHISFHGEEPVKPYIPPVVPPPAKPPVDEIVPVKPAPVIVPPESEPQKSIGMFSVPKIRETTAEPKLPELSVSDVTEEDVKPPQLPNMEPKQPEADDFVLNLEKEIASSSTDDITIDEEESEELKPSADEVTVNPEDTNNHHKEANFDNNRI
jgi:hypothetical protein